MAWFATAFAAFAIAAFLTSFFHGRQLARELGGLKNENTALRRRITNLKGEISALSYPPLDGTESIAVLRRLSDDA